MHVDAPNQPFQVLEESARRELDDDSVARLMEYESLREVADVAHRHMAARGRIVLLLLELGIAATLIAAPVFLVAGVRADRGDVEGGGSAGVSNLPIPLLVLGAFSLTLLVAGALGYLSRRRRHEHDESSADGE